MKLTDIHLDEMPLCPKRANPDNATLHDWRGSSQKGWTCKGCGAVVHVLVQTPSYGLTLYSYQDNSFESAVIQTVDIRTS
jgi:hypothetical protein